MRRTVLLVGGLVPLLVGLLLGVPGTPQASAVEDDPPSCRVSDPRGSHPLREGKAHTIWVDCSSPRTDERDLVVRVKTPPWHGSTSEVAWSADRAMHEIVYAPEPGYVGSDRFTVVVSDGTTTSEELEADFELVPNRAPACESTTYPHARPGDPTSFRLWCRDTDWQDYDTLDVSVVAAHGTVAVVHAVHDRADYHLVYTSPSGFEGTDEVTVSAGDGNLTTTATAWVNVSDRPMCGPLMIHGVRAGETGYFTAACTAPWGTPGEVAMELVTEPRLGTATPLPWTAYRYLARPDASGTETFSYRAVADGVAGPVVTGSFEVPGNAAPVCESGSRTLERGGTLDVTLGCRDGDGDDIEVTVARRPRHGTLTELVDGRVTYTPEPGFAGRDSFTYEAADYSRTSEPATVALTVSEPDPPVVGLRIGVGQSPAEAARGGLRVTLRSDETVAATLRLTVPARAAERLGLVRRADGPVRVGTTERRVRAGTTTLRVPLRPRAARLVGSSARTTLWASYAAVDRFGNTSKTSAIAPLRR